MSKPVMPLEQLVRNINTWMKYVREEGCIADIEDALGEYSSAIARNGYTRDQVYAAWLVQYA